jgi:apolipoprotein N-acyltransferase
MIPFLGSMKSNPWLPGLLSGIFLGVTTLVHGPVGYGPWAVFFGFVPLWTYWLNEPNANRVVLSGWVCQFTLTLVSCHWIAHTVNEFSHLGVPISLLVLLLYGSIANLAIPLAGYAWTLLTPAAQRRSAAGIALLVFLSALAGQIGAAIFPWNLGYAWLYLGLPGAQVADVAGFRWISSLTYGFNGLLVAAVVGRPRWRPLALAALSFGAINAFGYWRQRQLPRPDAVAHVLVIQPNAGNRDKEKLDHDPKFRETELARILAVTDRALNVSPAPPDFAVWPENAFPGYIADVNLTFGLSPLVGSFLRKHHLDLLTGGYGMNRAGETTNGLFALTREGKLRPPFYSKRVLLPFGEYVPFADRFPGLKRLFPDVRDYGRGDASSLLHAGGLRIGAEICYEGLFDYLARDLANEGAQILVNVTNDSWYGDGVEPWQHLYSTLGKAVENRRPFVRGTNNGVSSVALADGRILQISPVAEEWSHLYEVPYFREPFATPFQGWGFYLDWAFLSAGLALSLLLLLRSRRAIPPTER